MLLWKTIKQNSKKILKNTDVSVVFLLFFKIQLVLFLERDIIFYLTIVASYSIDSMQPYHVPVQIQCVKFKYETYSVTESNPLLVASIETTYQF